jgi:membrane protease YdiL (CAAX protease family)
VFTLYIPWDFALVLVFLAVFVPWRGAARMKRLLSKPETTARERLSLYASTIVFQWLLTVLIFLLCGLRTVSFEELGLAAPNPWQIAWVSIVMTAILCTTQVIGLRKMAQLPEEKRGSLFAITQRIMPRTTKETALYAALACTAGISEEFLYRGFVFMAFVRMIVNYGPPSGLAAILSSGWFSLAHLYQGRRGILTTFIVGLIFVGLRIWTASLIPPMLAHIGIDLTIGIYASGLFRQR